MKRTFILEDLDCAHCAKKIEEAVAKIEGVSECTVTFLTQKLTYTVDDDRNEAVEKEMRKIVKSTEPDVTVTAK